jgi:hypothetical protein
LRLHLLCWWANADFLEEDVPPGVVLEREEDASTSTAGVERGKKEDREGLATSMLARGAEESKDVAGAIRNAMALLESVLREAPTRGVESVA